MGFNEGQTGHLAKHDAIDVLTAAHTAQIAAGDVTNPASAAAIALAATYATPAQAAGLSAALSIVFGG
ncbi:MULTISPECIES: hypothetical protein [unclassified Cryobacterium]|uniref:hypothetical protein n=1 Tax=unclassified Cryobacterium TaxID=2649013 RepID=UPI00106B9C52|nr:MULTISPECIES: hypothetical protein [unclassified Cryobacterium]TFB96513.1 hypothetical protein E3O39_10600 [Cryobacterium sp. MDB2-A-1]TFC12798.1 hypothetical protein E3O35_07765 [Cryobacterium sp. MDB2-A-2]